MIGGKYHLSRVLGVGAVGAVYEGKHDITGKRVAIKVIEAAIIRSLPTISARFAREARAASAIDHQAIVQVLDAGEDDGGALYLVFECLDGQTLEDALLANALSPSDIVDLGIELLDALAAAHAAGFVHRDIKPENLFVTPRASGGYALKVLDFGIAKQKREIRDSILTQRGTLLGTLRYMSPEQAAGSGDVDDRSDLWSAGATLYRAFAGEPPFVAEDTMRLYLDISQRPVTSLAERCPELRLAPAVIEVVHRALDRNLATRWQSAKEMGDALRAARRELQRTESTLVTRERIALPPKPEAPTEELAQTLVEASVRAAKGIIPSRWQWLVLAPALAVIVVSLAAIGFVIAERSTPAGVTVLAAEESIPGDDGEAAEEEALPAEPARTAETKTETPSEIRPARKKPRRHIVSRMRRRTVRASPQPAQAPVAEERSTPEPAPATSWDQPRRDYE